MVWLQLMIKTYGSNLQGVDIGYALVDKSVISLLPEESTVILSQKFILN